MLEQAVLLPVHVLRGLLVSCTRGGGEGGEGRGGRTKGGRRRVTAKSKGRYVNGG